MCVHTQFSNQTLY